jgi:SAM-dependent methyltransferase
LYQCLESGYSFYHPFEVSGDSAFYEKLQTFAWYYMPWKWEHQIASELVKENDRILEIGCGKGDFFTGLSQRFHSLRLVGLELNKSADTQNDYFSIIDTPLSEFAAQQEGQFDIVCSFEVLEHVPAVYDFLSNQVKCLKKGGQLLISVPNMDSFIKYNKNDVLNMPPHHMGLWNEKALRKIADLFNLKVERVSYEPLQEQHFYFYTFIKLKQWIGEIPARIILKIVKLMGLSFLYRKPLKQKASSIIGHTIFIAFRK